MCTSFGEECTWHVVLMHIFNHELLMLNHIVYLIHCTYFHYYCRRGHIHPSITSNHRLHSDCHPNLSLYLYQAHWLIYLMHTVQGPILLILNIDTYLYTSTMLGDLLQVDKSM